jgi:Methyltransferase domain
MLDKFYFLLRFLTIRKLIGRIRLWYFMNIMKKWNYSNSLDSFEITLEHNLKSLRDFDNQRMDLLIKPLSVFEFLDKKTTKILVIGPRNENDLLNLMSQGFLSKNICGLDLMSYSPLIDVGDMHDTPYKDSTFDVILCGWTLSYSGNPEKFSKEAIRVAKNGCVIGIAVEYSTLTPEDTEKLVGYKIDGQDFERINSTEQINQLFDKHIKDIYFTHDAPNKVSHLASKLVENPSAACSIFMVTK